MANIPIGNYRKNVPFDERKLKATTILNQHSDRIPVVVECSEQLQSVHPLKKNKFIVPFELTLAQFMFVIRKHMKLESTYAIYVFINNKLHPTRNQHLAKGLKGTAPCMHINHDHDLSHDSR
jgi:GABA(A) receptor-associated protein